jgi:membrane-bound serine protease (ClpP class)
MEFVDIGPPSPYIASRTFRSNPMKSLLHILTAVCLYSQFLAAQPVHLITIDATINPATADFIHESIQRAKEDGAQCLIIRLNTPGGLLKSTRVIVTDILTAPLPVVVYVSPPGAQAASAGVFVTMAAHIAAMAEGTNIGAAHPVTMQGGEKDSIMNEKATNDAAAFIRTISDKRHRNVRWAEEAVRTSISITQTEALRDSVIDLVAPSVSDLLEKIDGKQVILDHGPVTLRTRGEAVIEKTMDWKHRILDVLSDPNIAYVFFLLGIYGLLFELYNSGSILPGVVGAISLILAFYSLHTLPVNYAGLALIIVGIVLFILELKVASYGLLSVGGALALLLGSIMLIDSESSLEFIRISWSVILPAVGLSVLFFVFAIGMGVRAQRLKPTTGVEGLIGTIGHAMTPLAPEGQVQVHGEIWNARTVDETLEAGTPVVVCKIDNLLITVRKA